MRKAALTFVFGVFVLMGSAWAQVECIALPGCQRPDPMFDRAPQPAIHFIELKAATVHIEAGVWGAPDCQGTPDVTAEGDLPLKAGPQIVFLRFMPPIEAGTMLSIRWMVGNCPITACINYTIGTTPISCEPPTGSAIPASELAFINLAPSDPPEPVDPNDAPEPSDVSNNGNN